MSASPVVQEDVQSHLKTLHVETSVINYESQTLTLEDVLFDKNANK